MSKKTFYVLMAVSMVAVPGFAAQEHVVKVQNSVRVGYDDNIYYSSNKEGSAFITDILNLTGKFHVSDRTEFLLYWQPEVRYRFDADPKTITYQDLYANLSHAMSERVFLTLSDHFRYQMKDGQTGPGVSIYDQNYIDNDLKGALDIDTGDLSQVKLGAGYELRQWDDSNYGEGNLNNDFDRYELDGSYLRQLNQNKTTGALSVNYVDHEYAGNRGGYQATSLIGGVDQNFNPNLTGFGRVGATMSSVDNQTDSNDNTSPYFDSGIEYSPSEQTRINAGAGYSIYYSDNSIYNAQDQLNLRLGVRHDLTAKISVAGTIAYIFSMYDADYDYKEIYGDTDDQFIRISLRGSYQINRNNFIEAGYEFSDRSTDTDSPITDYNRNTVDIGWKLRL